MRPVQHPPLKDLAPWKSWVWRISGVLVLFIAAFATYGPTLRYQMICDDYPTIIDNTSIHQLFPLIGPPGENSPLKPKSETPVTARPLVSLTLAINYYFSQLDPVGYRLTHIIAHAVVAIILWSIVSSTLRRPFFQGKFDQQSQWLGFVSAMIWMLHPTHSETVVYLTQRTELQMGLFYALTVLLSIRFWESSGWLPKFFWSILVFASSVCGMLSKEMMASAPAMVFFYEWTFIGGSLWGQAKRSWPLYVALVLSWAPIIFLYGSGVRTPVAGFHNVISGHDFWLTQANSFFVYWRLTFLPWPLLFHYHVDILSTFSQAWPGVLGLGLYLVVCAYCVWRRMSVGYMMLWYFAVLSPTLIVPLPHEEISERRLYVTLMAAIPFFCVVGFQATQWLGSKVNVSRQRNDSPVKGGRGKIARNLLGTTLATSVVVAYILIGTFTLPRLQYRADVWKYVLHYQPHNTFALCGQGMEECFQGKTAEGLEKIQAAYDSDPGYTFFNLSLAQTLDGLQEHQRMLQVCRQMHEMFPEQVAWAYALAVSLERNQLFAESMDMYRETIRLSPTSWASHSALATLLAEDNNLEESIQHFEIATELHPDFVNCMNLMTVYLNIGANHKALDIGKKLLEAARKEKSEEEVKELQTNLERMERSMKAFNSF